MTKKKNRLPTEPVQAFGTNTFDDLETDGLLSLPTRSLDEV